MSAKAITEFDGKRILAKWLLSAPGTDPNGASSFMPSTKLARIEIEIANAHAPYKPAAEIVPATLTAATAIDPASIHTQLSQAFDALERSEAWLLQDRLVVKPDQLIKRRGKLGLLGINLTWAEVKRWISERAGTTIQVRRVRLHSFNF